MRFLTDSMLGRLAKWLRVMGFDTHYQPFYQEGMVESLMREGRLLLSRRRSTADRYPESLFIRSDHVKDQLLELRENGYLTYCRSSWFARCIICNLPLRNVAAEDARENVPEYVFYQNITGIRFCPSCSRYFWPGTHRRKMIRLLDEWGFS
ncbi:MAG: hypothetical protein JRJ65_01755 [Deltaproteobacteria bacterium]|nr:hypothetical protein [Deltaproteobacteria bacterium]